jgi:hypothetical protein
MLTPKALPKTTDDEGEDGDGDGDDTPLVEVSNPMTAGPAPPGRMGHSCVVLPAHGASFGGKV